MSQNRSHVIRGVSRALRRRCVPATGRSPRTASTRPSADHYPFAEKPHAALGVKMTSNGQIGVFARARPEPGADMEELFSTQTRTLDVGQEARFTFRLADYNVGSTSPLPDKSGILTIEETGWPRGYEMQVVHMLGHLNPFGLDEMDYEGESRPADIPATREFEIRFARVTSDKSLITVRDPFEIGETTIDLSRLNVLAPDSQSVVKHCAFMIVARVTDACYDDGCVTLAFASGPRFDGSCRLSGRSFAQRSAFKLNRTSDGPQ
jgi:hypothetical protein